MYAICVESSHYKGMGHFFRMLSFIEYLQKRDEKYTVFINNDRVSTSILEQKKINYELVNYADVETNWEKILIKKYEIKIWINDRLNTEKTHAKNVINNQIPVITFDDKGSGAELADINFGGLEFENITNLKGKKVFIGVKYLILNSEINNYKRIRKNQDNILVTLGGSDTYGTTILVIKILKALNKKATVITGPSFKHTRELNEICTDNFIIKTSVPSLIHEFYNYDLAITGGGITPFEANASGLPCIIVASEIHEISNGTFLEKTGSSIFAGYYKEINKNIFEKELNISNMSKIGIEKIKTNAVENIYLEIKSCIKQG